NSGATAWSWADAGFAGAFHDQAQVGHEYIWDPTGGPNDLVQVRSSGQSAAVLNFTMLGAFSTREWAVTDVNHSLISCVRQGVGASGRGPFPRVHYRAYGTPILAAPGDANGNGETEFSDFQNNILTNFGAMLAADGGSTVAGFARIDIDQNGQIG